jgi:nucleobase transporter 1/2
VYWNLYLINLLLIVTGIVGVLVRYITPLTIVPTVSLIGLSFFENAANAAMQHWGIAAG